MTKAQAFEHCDSIDRRLPLPGSQPENTFYGEFAKQFARQSSANLTTRFWLGISDDEVESLWVSDINSSPVEGGFSAWGVGQPDNGGSFGAGVPENCAALDTAKDNNWFDVDCNLEMSFFCA